jgi:hypothetical protein
VRLIEASETGIGGEFDQHRLQIMRRILRCPICPFDRLLEAVRGEMGVGQASGGKIAGRIKRAQTQCSLQCFGRSFGLIAKRMDPTLGDPREGRIRIERDSPVGQRGGQRGFVSKAK